VTPSRRNVSGQSGAAIGPAPIHGLSVVSHERFITAVIVDHQAIGLGVIHAGDQGRHFLTEVSFKTLLGVKNGNHKFGCGTSERKSFAFEVIEKQVIH
jgi:hypothetical protein